MTERTFRPALHQGEIHGKSLPAFQHTPLSERFGVDAQLLCDQALRNPSDDLARIALADLLESKGEEDLPAYIKLSLTEPKSTHTDTLLRTNRDAWSTLFVPSHTTFDEPPTVDFHRGLPSRVMTCGSFIWEGWYCPVTIPVQRILSRYGAPPDEFLQRELSALARYARDNREGTGLNEVEILVHAVGPVVEQMNPVAPAEDLYKAVSSSIHLLRELHARGIPTSRCPRSCLGAAMRATHRELLLSEVQEIGHDILFTIDGLEGRGSLRGAIFEGLIPLMRMLTELRAHAPLRAYLPTLCVYVNGLASVGVPIEPVMRQQFFGLVQGLANDSSPQHFGELTTSALHATRRT